MQEEPLAFGEIYRLLEQQRQNLRLKENQLEFRHEKDEFSLLMHLDEVFPEDFLELISIAKRFKENWRIHTYEKGYLSLQALNNNLFSTEGLFEQIKIRLSALGTEKQLEIRKRGNPTQSEISLINALVRAFVARKKNENPLEQLRSAGCQIFLPQETHLTLEDFAGYEEVKNQIMETIILPLLHPEVYDSITHKTRRHFETNRPRAVLFSGPPGVGKTTMAKIIGHEASYPLVYVPLENILSAYYGESSKRLAMIFDIAAQAPEKGLIIFLDEIDSLAPSRNEKLFEATRRMLSVLLRKIEGLESKTNYLTIGATNRPQDLDPALMSRFDTILEFPLPAEDDIIAMLALYARHLTQSEKAHLAKKMLGLSPRAIKDICKKAERKKAREIILEQKQEIVLPQLQDYLQALNSARANSSSF
ncbi:MAG: AAA family ATPase [Leptospiraceae bacterium]|nr:AAA family ATPase [Leptospiraceae bacterium]MDW8306658.1 AAA family ATPase [Leptospiraceae bacterium]